MTTPPPTALVGFSISGLPYAVTYGDDVYGHFIVVTAQVHVLTHGYMADSDLMETMINSHGHTATRTHDPVMPYFTRVHNGLTGGCTISQCDYCYDTLGRRTAIASLGEAFIFSNANDLAAFNLYGYNTRSEVTSAARYWGTDTGDTSEVVAGQQYAYEFDPIGNRITSAEGDTSRTAAYTANALNQYEERTVPGVKELAGTALADAAVTVNDLPTDRHGPWWHHSLEVDNTLAAAYDEAVIAATHSNFYSTATGNVCVAQTPEQFQYDADGNLTQDGRFDYTWNGENRLIKAETRDDLPADVPRVKVEYAYDHQGRMAWKQISTNLVAISTRTLIWDGYNIIRETINHQQPTTNYYVWGLDLSGTLQGAGGVGGLLAEVKAAVPYFAAFDANGNVTEYVSTDGTLAAHYEYSPFGEIVVQSGELVDSFTHRFSTKPWCQVTGLSEYEYRKYSTGMGRWISRDPIEEDGGHNLYGCMGNEPVGRWDLLGNSVSASEAEWAVIICDLINPGWSRYVFDDEVRQDAPTDSPACRAKILQAIALAARWLRASPCKELFERQRFVGNIEEMIKKFEKNVILDGGGCTKRLLTCYKKIEYCDPNTGKIISGELGSSEEMITYAYTRPNDGQWRIWVCPSSCDDKVEPLASWLIHELFHEADGGDSGERGPIEAARVCSQVSSY